MSEALDIERIALAEVRLLRQARSGDSAARRELLAPYAPSLWAVCAVSFPADADRMAAWQAFQDTLADAVPAFQVDKPVGVQLFAHLWQGLTLGMSPAGSSEPTVRPAPQPMPSRSRAADRQRVLDAVHALSPADRVVWGFVTVTGLGMERLAELTGAGESSLRSAYSRASWAVYRALTQ